MKIKSEKEDSDVAIATSIPFFLEQISRKLLTLGIETRGEHHDLTYIVTLHTCTSSC